ncbi:hypothetical protein ACA910_019022 [Epithemia clementina (nom. ined.)]
MEVIHVLPLQRKGADQESGINEIADASPLTDSKPQGDKPTQQPSIARRSEGPSLLVTPNAHGGASSKRAGNRNFSPSRAGIGASSGNARGGGVAVSQHSASKIPENESPSPPGSSTTVTLATTSASSSGAPSVVGAVNSSSADGGGGESSSGAGGGGDGSGSMMRYPQSTEQHHFHARFPLENGADHLSSGLYSDQHPSQSPQNYETGRYSHGSNPARFPVAIKLLVSNNVAGSIIGRQGQTISELQTRSLTRIKLSQSGDYFPGTHDRVCLVQGEPSNIKTALRMLLERMHLLQEQETSAQQVSSGSTTAGIATSNTWQGVGGGNVSNDNGGSFNESFGAVVSSSVTVAPSSSSPSFVVRLLVPSSSCGMIIGKAGSNIKYLEESTGVVSVRLSPKDQHPLSAAGVMVPSPDTIGFPGQLPPNLLAPSPTGMIGGAAASERALTITGPTLESCLQCTFMVFEGMISHPDVSRYLNMTTSYARKTRPSTSAPTAPTQMHGTPLTPAPTTNDMLAASSVISGGIGFADPPAVMFPQHHNASSLMHPSVISPSASAGTLHDPLHQTPQYLPQHQPHVRHYASPQQHTKLGGSSQKGGVVSRGGGGNNSDSSQSPQTSKSVSPKRNLSLSEIGEGDGHQHPEIASYEYKHFSANDTALSPAEMAFPPPLLPANFPLPPVNMNDRPLPYSFPGAVGANMEDPDGMLHSGRMSHSSSSPDLFTSQLDPQPIHYTPAHESSNESSSQSKSSSAATPAPSVATSANHSYLVPVAPTCLGPSAFQAQMAVPDSMVGSILGRAGRTLNELQLMSGTRIWISQRGEFIPGTRNRIVTVRGPTAQSVWQTQMFIGQRIVLPPTAAATGANNNAPSSAPGSGSNSSPPSSSTSAMDPTPSHQSQHSQQPKPPPSSSSSS